MAYENFEWASDVEAEHETLDMTEIVTLGAYEQRIEGAIQNERESFRNFTYSGSPAELKEIEAFLKKHSQAKAFYLNVPAIYPTPILVRRDGNIRRTFIGGVQKRISFDLVEVLA